jgi:hypothetical protein
MADSIVQPGSWRAISLLSPGFGHTLQSFVSSQPGCAELGPRNLDDKLIVVGVRWQQIKHKKH